MQITTSSRCRFGNFSLHLDGATQQSTTLMSFFCFDLLFLLLIDVIGEAREPLEIEIV